MAYGLTEILNRMNELGIFSYAFPFMIIFAIVFGLLQKTKIFGGPKEAKGINAIIAVAIGFLSLLYDQVPTFFATIFPKFGIGLAVFLVLIISLGFFYIKDGEADEKKLGWIGGVIGIGVVLWAFNEWGDRFGGIFGVNDFSYFLQEYLPVILVFIGIFFAIKMVMGEKESKK